MIWGVGKLRAGTTYNAVAEDAELEGTTRTISQEMRLQVRDWIGQTAQNVAGLSGAKAQVIWTDITPALVNDQQASREVAKVAAGLGHNIQIVTDRPLSLGGDNFAEFLRKVPACYAYLGTSIPCGPKHRAACTTAVSIWMRRRWCLGRVCMLPVRSGG